MIYRYYVEDIETGHGLTEFSTNISNHFCECLNDIVNWYLWEVENTDVLIYYFIGDKKHYINFRTDLNNEQYITIGIDDGTTTNKRIAKLTSRDLLTWLKSRY